MINTEKYLETLEKTPIANWKKVNLAAPEILTEVYNKIFNLINGIWVEGLGAAKEANLDYLPDRGESYIHNNLFGAGGYVSDYLISKIHSTPFEPKDLDIFIGGGFLEGVLKPVVKPDRVEIEEAEAKMIMDEEDVFDFPSVYKEGDKYYKVGEEMGPWEYFGRKVKEIFPDCSWKDNCKDGYEFAEINVVYYINHKGLPIEIVVGEDKRILNFDISFRCAYFNNGNFYMNSMGLEDIKEKRMRILHSETPISTALRMMDFQERYGFEIDSLSLMLLFHSVNTSKLEKRMFLQKFREHKKYSKQLEEKLFSYSHEIRQDTKEKYYTNGKSSKVKYKYFHFNIEEFSDYDPKMTKIYDSCIELLRDKGSILYPKLETFLRSYKEIKFSYVRPENWYKEEIFIKAHRYQKEFMNWYNQKRLTMTFESPSVNYYFDADSLSSEDLDMLYKAIQLGERPEDEALNGKLEEYIPFIAINENIDFEFNEDTILKFLLDERLVLSVSGYHYDQSIVINRDKKEISLGALSNDIYFGLVGDLYLNYANQIKNALNLRDYEFNTTYDFTKETNASKFFWIGLKDMLENAEELKESISVEI